MDSLITTRCRSLHSKFHSFITTLAILTIKHTMAYLLPIFAIAAAAAGTCAGSTPSSVAADLSGSTDSIFLPWTSGFINAETPRVAMNIEGVGNITMATDTGSTGIIISKGRIANYDTVAQDAPHCTALLEQLLKALHGQATEVESVVPWEVAFR